MRLTTKKRGWKKVKNILLFFWSLIDPLYFYFSRLTYPPCVEKEENILRIRLTKYKGRNVTLSDGTTIEKNDLLVKIHLHNVRLLKELRHFKSELKKVKIILEYVQKSLPGVEAFIRMNPHAEKIKGIIGITSRTKGSERLGFEVFEIIHPVYRYFKTLSFLPIHFISSRCSLKDLLVDYQPKYLFMSVQQLSSLYGKTHPQINTNTSIQTGCRELNEA